MFMSVLCTTQFDVIADQSIIPINASTNHSINKRADPPTVNLITLQGGFLDPSLLYVLCRNPKISIKR